MSLHLDRLIEAMSDPAIYPHGPKSVHVIQTHISVVFLADDLVYKIKKPVNFGFLDFTTLEKRKYFCEREVLLNSRFSDGVYLGVASVHDGPSGLNLQGRGVEIEAAVLMKRIPDDRMMLRMLERDRVTPEILDRVADRIAGLHADAPTGPEIAGHGSFEVISQNLKENFDQTGPFVGRTLDRRTREEVFDLSIDFMKSHRDLFRERMTGGFIRDCHGDLHLDHVLVLDGIMLIDCIEFNDRFRFGDTAADLGFLLMDLDFQGYPAFAEHVSGRYSVCSGDGEILKLVGFYRSYRAFVRGKVMGFTLDEPEVSRTEKESAAQTAGHYFSLSLAYLRHPRPPALIVMCGLMGTGKSFLATRLGKRLGIDPVKSDVIRKEIHGVPSSEHRLDKYGGGIYTSNSTEVTYEALFERARRSLGRRNSVVLDASFSLREHRFRARDLALEMNAQFLILECVCPDGEARARLEERMETQKDPSDGRWQIYLDQKRRFEPIERDELGSTRQWDSTTDPNAFLKAVVRELVAP